MRERRFAVLLVCCLGLGLRAQEVLHESLTDRAKWTHKGGPPAWTDGVKNAAAHFGKVDRLNASADLDWRRNAPLVLDPGTYVATVRFAKIQDNVGAAPLDFQVVTASGTFKLTIPVAEQKVGSFVSSRALVFRVDQKSPTIFTLRNVDKKIVKRNYLFDSFHVGRIDFDQVVVYESLGRRWGHAWGCPHYSKEVRDKESAFGFVERLNQRWSSLCGSGQANLWWFDWTSGVYKLQAATYTANLRVKKIVSAMGAADFRIRVERRTPPGNWLKFHEIVFPAAAQKVGRYVYSPDLTFQVTPITATDEWRFKWQHLGGMAKENMHIDAFVIRRGALEPIGQGCRTSLGELELTGQIPVVNRPADLVATNVPGAVIFTFGTKQTKLDLTSLGMPGCTAYTTPIASVGAGSTSGRARFAFRVPNNIWLIGKTYFNQAFGVDPKANTLGLASSNGRRAVIGF